MKSCRAAVPDSRRLVLRPVPPLERPFEQEQREGRHQRIKTTLTNRAKRQQTGVKLVPTTDIIGDWEQSQGRERSRRHADDPTSDPMTDPMGLG